MAGVADIKHPKGDDLIAIYKERYGEKTLLAFSRGKDSIGAALALRDKLDVIPVYYEGTPGLEFVEESLAYYEKHLFGRHILRMPAPATYKHLRDMMFQPMSRANILSAASIPPIDYADVAAMVKKQEGVDQDVLSATGLRAGDNMVRMLSIKNHGPIRHNAGNWAPIWDWSQPYLLERIEQARISLPPDYTFMPRSLDGYSFQYLIPMKQHYPRDYRQILRWFPLAEAELLWYEIHRRLEREEAANGAQEG